MIQKLEKAYQQLVSTQSAFIQRLEGMSEAQLLFQPSEDEWSPLLVWDHIIVSESKVLDFLKRYPVSKASRKVGFKSKITNAALAQFYKSGGKVKMPVKGLAPTGGSLTELKQISEDNLSYIKGLITHFPEDKMSLSVFKHPVSGNMTMYATVHFLRNHILHHVHQLNRIEKHAHYPR